MYYEWQFCSILVWFRRFHSFLVGFSRLRSFSLFFALFRSSSVFFGRFGRYQLLSVVFSRHRSSSVVFGRFRAFSVVFDRFQLATVGFYTSLTIFNTWALLSINFVKSFNRSNINYQTVWLLKASMHHSSYFQFLEEWCRTAEPKLCILT